MNSNTNYISNSIKIGIIIIWCILFVMLLKRDVLLKSVDLSEKAIIEQAESEEYQSIFFKQQKIGYAMQRHSPQPDNSILLVQDARLNLNVAGSVQAIELSLQASLTAGSILQSFQFSFTSPFYNMDAVGEVSGKTIHYTIDTGSSKISHSMSLPKPPMLATARRSYLLQENLEPGDKVKIPWFDPFSLTAKESVVEYKGKKAIQIGARIEKLHHFVEFFSGARVNLWLNDSGRVVKEESPAGFVFIKEPKFRSLQLPSKGDDILAAVAVQLVGPLVPSEDQMSYRLDFPKDAILDLDGGRQQFENNILTITNEFNIAAPVACNWDERDLQATPYIQADHKDIISLKDSLIKDTPDPMARVQALGDWVYTNIDKRPVLGLPDALTTLLKLQGDCNEHAALFAALSRAANIPTRIIAGVTSHKKGLYYHAWNEVCVDNRWLSVDTTINQIPADLTHIRLVIGEMQEQVRLGALLGKLTVEPLTRGTKQ